MTGEFAKVLTPEALEFIGRLAREFEPRRRELLETRIKRQLEIDRGKLPGFLPETREIREKEWKIAPVPEDLQDRRVEITGPVDRKMIINALNSGANGFMADFEDSHAPTWEGNIQGQINLGDAVDGSITFTNEQGKKYALNDHTATLMPRPRGWHLVEKHVKVDGEPIYASIFDFGLYFFHNARKLIAKGSGPYFYLPKIESYLEARLWNDIFVQAQEVTGISVGTIKATVLIETIMAAFQVDEILYELRDHMAGLNCGRWDYIFSFIKWQWVHHPEGILSDGRKVTLDLFREIMGEELKKIREIVGEERYAGGNYEKAARLFDEIISNEELEEFLTLRAYEYLA